MEETMKKFGLNDAEVEVSRQKHGTNALTEQAQEGFWSKLWGNFGDPMIKILCVALIINVIFAILGQVEWYESVGIAAAVLLATLVSTFSESGHGFDLNLSNLGSTFTGNLRDR